jgi:hypothetical protein
LVASRYSPQAAHRRRAQAHDALNRPGCDSLTATAILAEIAEELVRVALADHPDEKTVSLPAISLSHLEQHSKLQFRAFIINGSKVP